MVPPHRTIHLPPPAHDQGTERERERKGDRQRKREREREVGERTREGDR